MHRLGTVSRPLLEALEAAPVGAQREIARAAAVAAVEQGPDVGSEAVQLIVASWQRGEDVTSRLVEAATEEAGAIDEQYLDAWEATPDGEAMSTQGQALYVRARAALAVAYAAEDTTAGFLDSLTESACCDDDGATAKRIAAERLGLDVSRL